MDKYRDNSRIPSKKQGLFPPVFRRSFAYLCKWIFTLFKMSRIVIEDWGLLPYDKAWQRQEQCLDEALQKKSEGRACTNRIVLVQHPHVYTLGRSGKEANMLLNPEALHRLGAALYRVDRGGDITYHGPGQLVCYPIIDLEQFWLGLKEYVHALEEAVICLCAAYGIRAGRVEGATGVWLEGDTSRARKVCAIGVRCSRYVTMHGLALNVNTDLRYFGYIHPCGFVDKGVTSLQAELHRPVDMDEVKRLLCRELEKVLKF